MTIVLIVFLNSFSHAINDFVAVPYVIMREDLIRVAPLWLKWTEGCFHFVVWFRVTLIGLFMRALVIRSDSDAWPSAWNEVLFRFRLRFSSLLIIKMYI